MKTTVALVALLIGVAAAGVVHRSSFIDKIVDGHIVEKGAYKHQVHIQMTMSFFGMWTTTTWGCGGSIIDSQWVLTAAHCVHDMSGKALAPSALKVKTGAWDTSILESHADMHNVIQVIVHAGYNKGTFDKDYALLKLAAPVEFDDHTGAVRLAAAGRSLAAGTELWVTGWGALGSGLGGSTHLMAVAVNKVDSATCNDKYGAGKITDSMMCAAAPGKDSCQGDSGGPLIVLEVDGTQTQVGVVSWGYGCADARYPGVYADVAHQIGWIKEKTGLNL